MADEEVLKEGWATKQGGFWKSWKKRWFVLTGKVLEYSKTPAVQAQGKIDLNDVSEISKAPQIKKGPALQLVTPERTYFMVLKNDAEVNEWIDVLNKAKKGDIGKASDENKKAKMTDYKILRILQKGVNSVMMLVKHKESGNLQVAKRYSKKLIGNQSKTLEIYNKIKGQDYDYLVNLYEVIDDGDSIVFILEYVTHSLADIFDSTPLDYNIATALLREVFEGISEYHQIGLYYGDFHMNNVLLDENGHAKLTLPGFALPIAKTQERYLQYIHPKALEESTTDKSYDFYGAALIYYEILNGYLPFISSDRKHLIEEKRKEIVVPLGIHSEAIDYLNYILSSNDPEKYKQGVDFFNKPMLTSLRSETPLIKKYKEENKYKRSWEDDKNDGDTILISFADDSALLRVY